MSSPSSTLPVPPDPPPLPAAAPDDYADPGARAIDLSTRPVAESLREIMASSPRLPKQIPPPLPAVRPPFRNRHWTLAMMGLLLLVTAFGLAAESVWHLVTGGLDGLAQDAPERARLLVEQPVWVAWHLMVGLGLILARRWARHLLLAELLGIILSSVLSWLAIAANNGPDFVSELSDYDSTPVWRHLVIVAVAAGVAWLLLAVLSHRHVRQTCEQAQPDADWTDFRSPSQLLLVVTLVGLAAFWAGLASYHPWPCWGVWRADHVRWVWGGAAAAAALSALLVAHGRQVGVWLAVALIATSASSVVITALRQPASDFVQLWDGWCFNQWGGLTYTIGGALITAGIALAALRSRHQSDPATPLPPTQA